MKYKIVFRSKRYDSGYEELHGSGCYTKKAMEKYCLVLGVLHRGMKVVPIDFDLDDPANKDYDDEPKKEASPIIIGDVSDEVRAELSKMWKEVMSGKA